MGHLPFAIELLLMFIGYNATFQSGIVVCVIRIQESQSKVRSR
jgi:hypothetical protein